MIIETLQCALCGKLGADKAHSKYGILCEECSSKTPVICDFCSSPNVKWSFPCDSYVAPLMGIPNFYQTEDWAACDKCKELIDAEKWDELSKWSLESPDMEWPPITPLTKEELLRGIVDMQNGFRANRKGPAVPSSERRRD